MQVENLDDRRRREREEEASRRIMYSGRRSGRDLASRQGVTSNEETVRNGVTSNNGEQCDVMCSRWEKSLCTSTSCPLYNDNTCSLAHLLTCRLSR
jgi:hypothetical protein